MKNFELRRLSEKFYQDYPQSLYKEIATKNNRPYIVFLVKIENNIFGLPF